MIFIVFTSAIILAGTSQGSYAQVQKVKIQSSTTTSDHFVESTLNDALRSEKITGQECKQESDCGAHAMCKKEGDVGRCIALYTSDELSALTNKYAQRRAKEKKLSNADHSAGLIMPLTIGLLSVSVICLSVLLVPDIVGAFIPFS